MAINIKKGLDLSNVSKVIDSEILSIQKSTPFMCTKAEEIYNISQEYLIPVDILIEFVIKSGLSAINIKRVIEAKEFVELSI